MDRERVVVAEIIRPRGNRGEVLAKSLTDVPDRFKMLKRAQLRLAGGEDVPVEIAEAWLHDGAWVLKFAGVDSIPAAERFRGADLWIAPESRGSLPEGEFFESDLTGCSLVDAATGAIFGVVEGWQHCGGPPLIETVVNAREVLIPFVPEICREVNLKARVIKLALPEGLLDL